ncbi:hypothetical protein GGR57DRAFT_367786 [Xylariaceae sp. FL1272]|nr:hypothetical protein GGR57DRAFT_367786 [Xylariaceae sp. FL1272]
MPTRLHMFSTLLTVVSVNWRHLRPGMYVPPCTSMYAIYGSSCPWLALLGLVASTSVDGYDGTVTLGRCRLLTGSETCRRSYSDQGPSDLCQRWTSAQGRPLTNSTASILVLTCKTCPGDLACWLGCEPQHEPRTSYRHCQLGCCAFFPLGHRGHLCKTT